MTSARADTRVLVLAPAITVDAGQWLTDLTAAGAGAFEDPSARTAIDGTAGRSLEMAGEISDADTGTLIAHGADVASKPYRIRVNEAIGSNAVTFEAAGVTQATIVAPALEPAPRDYVIAWSTEPNALATGPADALRSVAMVYDVTSAELAWTTWTHTAYAADDDGAFSVGGAWDGGVLLDPFTGTITSVRVSSRFHTRVETREHFVAQTPVPVVEGITAVEGPVVPQAATIEAGEPGGVYQAAAAAMRTGRNRHRMISPIVQVFVQESPGYGQNIADTVGVKWVEELGDGWQTSIGWLWRRRIPRHVSYVLIEIQWVTELDGLAPIQETELRAHAANRRPGAVTEENTVTISRAVDDTGGIGVRERFGLLRIVRDVEGYTWLFISARTGTNVSWMIRQIMITPVSVGDGFDPAQPPNGWGP